MSVHYYPFINKFFKKLSLSDKTLLKFVNGKHEAFSRPFITIAREPGSGGAPIARAVADKLGFVYVDEQIVDEIAKSTKKRKAVVASIDEKGRTAIQDLVHSLLNEDYINDLKYTRELTKVILAYAHQGNCVILGRGGNFITPFSKGLHVSVTAPYSIRVQRAIDFEGHSREKAKQVIADVEKERKKFVEQYLSKKANKRNAFDININTAYFKVNEARDVIIEAFHQKFSRTVRYGSMLESAIKSSTSRK